MAYLKQTGFTFCKYSLKVTTKKSIFQTLCRVRPQVKQFTSAENKIILLMILQREVKRKVWFLGNWYSSNNRCISEKFQDCRCKKKGWVRLTSWRKCFGKPHTDLYLQVFRVCCPPSPHAPPRSWTPKEFVNLRCRSHSTQMRILLLQSRSDGRMGLCRCPTWAVVKRDNAWCVNKYWMMPLR